MDDEDFWDLESHETLVSAVRRRERRIAQLEAALVEERARGNYGAEGNIDWPEMVGYTYGYGESEIAVQDFYRRDARTQLKSESLLR